MEPDRSDRRAVGTPRRQVILADTAARVELDRATGGVTTHRVRMNMEGPGRADRRGTAVAQDDGAH